MERTYDVVVFGATGFTGRLAAAYLGASPAARAGEVRWAIAGRNPEKLETRRAALAEAGTPPDGVIVADALDPAAMGALCAQARVVATTAGPYAKYGDPLVDACVAHGTDYVDITGETPWVRRVIDQHHATAAARGTRIIPFCGFDSVPSDIGALACVEHLERTRGTGTRAVRAAFAGKGGFNGGTLDTMLTMAEKGWLPEVDDPSLLNPIDRRPDPHAERDPRGSHHDADLGRWLAPFLMGPINTRVVRRSHALRAQAGAGYGAAFRYQEYMDCGRGLSGRATAMAVGGVLASSQPMLRGAFGRRLMRRFGPAPGEGPSMAQIEEGYTRATYVAEGEDGHLIKARLVAQGDPGNRVTVTILIEAALALALDRDALAPMCGVVTPATGIGLRLLERLRAAGFTFEVNDLAG